jgi:glycosyltransferase involved in cell wall biosynthesis
MPKLRICHIGFNFFPGQGLTIFYEFARHQARQGLDVTAIAPGRPGEPAFEIIDGVRLHRIPLDSIGRFSFDRFRFLIRAARIVRSNDFDLIHIYAFVGVGLLPLLSLRKDTRWLYDCQTSAIKPPLLGLQNWLIRLESHSFDAITVLSEGIRDIVFGPGTPVAAIMPLGADFDRFQPRPPDRTLMSQLGIAATDRVLSYCGTLDHNRRMDKLIDAFAFVVRQDNSAKLMIIGDGSALDELKEQVRKLKLDDRVIFTGLIPYDEIPEHLSVTAIGLAFISMDACFEQQPPTKTVEYLAQGLPVIATNTAGNRVFICHDLNGVLSLDSPEAYGQAMLDLIRDADRRLRLAAHARDSVKDFDWAKIVRMQVIPLYRNILRDHRLVKYE